MSRFWSKTVKELTPYVPGEQPKLSQLIKLNTNESPYGPSPKALAAIAAAKSPKASVEDRAEAKEDVNEAKYKAAAEKCDTLTSDAKTACIQAAKTAHGQR